MATSLDPLSLTVHLASLTEKMSVVLNRLDKLEISNLSTNPSAPSSSAPHSGRAYSRRGQIPVPTSTPTTFSPPTINLSHLSSKAVLEKTVITLLIPDSQAGHVVGRAGAGLKQIHDFSHAKVSVAPPVDNSGLRTVTIRGTAREVGDAIAAIGKRLAHRRVRRPMKKKASEPVPPPPQSVPLEFLVPAVPPPPPSPPLPPSIPPPSKPVKQKKSKTPSVQSSPVHSPMNLSTPTPTSWAGSPMHLDAMEAANAAFDAVYGAGPGHDSPPQRARRSRPWAPRGAQINTARRSRPFTPRGK